jgi:hypothetical protein
MVLGFFHSLLRETTLQLSELPNAVYTVTPQPGTLININPIVKPQFGQPGGLPEFQFLLGATHGTVSGPRELP